jgi:hypothetical protein
MEKALDLLREAIVDIKPYFAAWAGCGIVSIIINIIMGMCVGALAIYLFYWIISLGKVGACFFMEELNEKRQIRGIEHQMRLQEIKEEQAFKIAELKNKLERAKSEEIWKRKQIEARYKAEVEYDARFRGQQ